MRRPGLSSGSVLRWLGNRTVVEIEAGEVSMGSIKDAEFGVSPSCDGKLAVILTMRLFL